MPLIDRLLCLHCSSSSPLPSSSSLPISFLDFPHIFPCMQRLDSFMSRRGGTPEPLGESPFVYPWQELVFIDEADNYLKTFSLGKSLYNSVGLLSI